MQALTEILSMPCAAWVGVLWFVECMTFWAIFFQTSDPKPYDFLHFGASFLLHVSLEQLDVWGVKCGV